MGYRQIHTGSERGIQGGIWPAPPQAPAFVQLFMEVEDVAQRVLTLGKRKRDERLGPEPRIHAARRCLRGGALLDFFQTFHLPPQAPNSLDYAVRDETVTPSVVVQTARLDWMSSLLVRKQRERIGVRPENG